MNVLDQIIRVHDRADELLRQHNLTDWSFELSNEKLTLGRCYYEEKKITFSKYYLNAPWDEIEDTLRHEIAHAIAGPRHGHNATWRRIAISVGARPEACAPPEIETSATPNYIIKCPTCGRSWKRYRLRRQMFKAEHCGVTVKVYKVRKA